MKLEVKHTKSSEEYLKKVFTKYKEVDKYCNLITVNGRCVIHLYAKEDTRHDNSNVFTGYGDAYNCEVYVFDEEKKLYYKTKYHDQVEIDRDVNACIRIFKDLSTVIIIPLPCKVLLGQSILVVSQKDRK
ncbi:hypothetical protein ACFHWD_03305 [Clostridium sp. MT-14]|uniref:hypothetical protein n=1 Tax=Clostridium sp. MT-14 TaxID=3348360 RepID=UPI0035F36A1A